MDDMLAIPLMEIVKGISGIKEKGIAEEDCVLLVSQDKENQKFYIIQKKDLGNENLSTNNSPANRARNG